MKDKLGYELAMGIWSEVIDEFTPSSRHLSMNLIDSTRVSANQYGYYVKINPQRYDQRLYINRRILKFTGKGSYASEVDNIGGIVLGRFTNHHIDYIDKAVIKGIRQGLSDYGIKKYKISIGMQSGR